MQGLKIALLIFFIPTEGFRWIKKDRTKFSYSAPLVILALLLVARIFNVLLTHFPLAGVLPEDARFSQELLTILAPLAIFIVSCYLVTTILSGETLLREVFSATLYALLPLAVLTFPLTMLSWILSASSAGVYNTLFILLFLWSAILVLISISCMNSYSLKKTLLVAFLAICASVFIVVVLSLLYVLGIRVVDFVKEVLTEYRILFWG